ncbi:uncharacterized protein LOC143621790 [Bidens hawaiensis]|uniref:uncharacterized protein LOC143621790 n=1 Tax=Bidens hawaiensis TaxID=980011 RepID=UPI00404A6BAA
MLQSLPRVNGDANQIWEAMATKIIQVAQETLEITKGKPGGHKESWWWNEVVQNMIRDKHRSIRALMRCTNEEERVELREFYKTTKREAKKAVSEAENTAYKRMYERLETK